MCYTDWQKVKMSLKGLHSFFPTGRICFLQVLWKSTSVLQGDSASTEEHLKEARCAIDDLYSSEHRSTVLHLLNSASKEELAAVKLIQGRKSVYIIEHRDMHGPFQDLQSLLKVPMFQYETAVKLCNLILKQPVKEEGKKQSPISVMKYITPEIEKKRLKTATNIVSVVFGTHKIAWAHVDRHLAVQDWQQQECRVFMRGAYVPAVYLQEISSIVSGFPEADFYVLEKNGLSKTNTSLFPVLLHLRTVEAMLYALLHKTFAQDGQQKVLSMTRNVVGKYFGLMIGDVRTSGINLVKQLLLESLTQVDARVSFSSHQRLYYRNVLSSGKQKRDEELCDALLQAIAFCELLMRDKTP